MDASERFLELSRFWVQRVLVPILVLIGAAGNIVTVIILTRRRMRCSTNIYLTALAIADVIYLLFVLILSFKHYPNINDIRYVTYWRFSGLNHWLADAASSTSIWLVVCFTIERYIAVCHPIRGKVLCTENRAKRVIAAVSILCFLTTMSTAFEYQLTTSEYCIQKECDNTQTMFTSNVEIVTNPETNPANAQALTQVYDDSDNINDVTESLDVLMFEELDSPIREIIVSDNLVDCQYNDTGENCSTANDSFLSKEDCCVTGRKIETEATNLGKNETYKTVFYWFTSITFTFLPLGLIATFNCFLVNAVRNSQKQRKQMTKSQENSSQAQEHRMTLILIAVVILFLICQTPSACILIYASVYPDFDKDFTTNNLVRGLGNVFNLLVSINAACNFLLYCALSEKYRRTFKTVFCGSRVGRQDTFITSLSGTSQRITNQKNGFRRNISAYVPRNLQAQPLNSIPRAKTMIVRQADRKTNGKLV